MKITFIASHTQKNELSKYYHRIVAQLEKLGYEVFTGSLFSEKGTDYDSLKGHKERENWYQQCLKDIQKSDLVVVEISYPSTANVGHELTYALDIGKPVLALYKSERDPVFLSGRNDDKLFLYAYTDKDLEVIVESGIELATTVQDVRFNFFISPQIGRYLDWVSKNKRVPRAVYLRRLIEEDMRGNKEYNEGGNE